MYSFQEDFDTFLTERIQSIDDAHKCDSIGYLVLRKEYAALFDQVDALAKNMPEQDRAIFARYFDTLCHVRAEEQAYSIGRVCEIALG